MIGNITYITNYSETSILMHKSKPKNINKKIDKNESQPDKKAAKFLNYKKRVK